jgi:Gpi18-like mannosyltransferase
LNIKALIRQIPKPFKLAILIVLAAKILVLAIGYLVTYLNEGAAPPLSIFQSMFHYWDSSNYVNIAQHGYVNTGEEASFIVFFPLYPLLIKAVTFDYAYGNITALAIANVCSIIAFIYLYKLAKLEFNEGVAVKAVLFLSIFPTAYFLCAPYTEGLFFALIIACFYYARVGKWWLAGSLSFLASLTRLAGLLMLPVLVLEYLHQTGWKPKKIRPNVAFVFSALAGFLIYLGINQSVTGNPFTFMAIEASKWNNTFDPWKGLTAAWYWAGSGQFAYNLTIGVAPLAFAIFGLVMMGVGVWKRMRPSYILYMFLTWGLALSTSWWISVPRYIMAMFPVFILLGALTKKKAVNIALVAFSVAWLCFFTVLFALGWWAF